MSITTAPLPKAAKGERPVALKDADHERLLNMIVALTAEISVLQEQQDTLRRIIVDRGIASNEDIAHFQPDPTAAAERATKRRQLIERVMRIVIADAERAARNEQPYEELLAMVSAPAV